VCVCVCMCVLCLTRVSEPLMLAVRTIQSFYLAITLTWNGGHYLSNLQTVCERKEERGKGEWTDRPCLQVPCIPQDLFTHAKVRTYTRCIWDSSAHPLSSHRMVVFPALSRPKTRIRASLSPNQLSNLLIQSPIFASIGVTRSRFS